jgi:N-acyl-L-homoserine lactone synthetase
MSTENRLYRARIIGANSPKTDLEQVFSFRKTLFVDTLKWSLETHDQFEVDQFDSPKAAYGVLFRDNGLVGSFRAIRTDGPYLADQVFPELALTKPYPKTPRCFEISRFGVLPQSHAKEDAAVLYALMFHFALLRRARSLVAVTDLFHERYLARRCIRSRRFGPPKEYPGSDVTPSFTLVAGEIPIGLQTEADLTALLSHLNGVTIHDDTLVYGRQSISA